MTIDQAYQLVNFVSNKKQRGNIIPADFNLIAPIAQKEVISNLLGNEQLLSPSGVPPYGYKANRKIDTLLRPLIVSPVTITVTNGLWDYPEGFIWPDACHKSDFSLVEIIDSDQYPSRKKSMIKPPTSDYPVIILRYPQGYCDPVNLGSFEMSYVKMPTDPYWAYTEVNDEAVYTASGSVDFALHELAHMRICLKILQAVGINLDSAEITQYAFAKEQQGT